MTVGKQVTLISYKDVVIRRRLVAVENGLLFVCTEKEFQLASREGREPTCIGFKPEYLLRAGVVS
jgi:hypothetical protein